MVDHEPVGSVTVPAAAGTLDGAWRLLVALANEPAMPRWVLIGGLMVELHAHEHAVTPPRLTDDADVLVDIRASPGGLSVIARWLTDHGLQLEAPDPTGVAHRFRGSDGVVVDLLAPDHVGPRADLSTMPTARTIQVVAGTQLARDAEAVRVAYRDDQGNIVRPTLVAAILGKYRAYRQGMGQSARPADRHLTDVVSCSRSSVTPAAPRPGCPPATAGTSPVCTRICSVTTAHGGCWTTPPTPKPPCASWCAIAQARHPGTDG